MDFFLIRYHSAVFFSIKENIHMEQDELSGIQAEINYMLRVPDLWKPVKAGNMKEPRLLVRV